MIKKTAKNSFGNAAKFKYLRAKGTDQNCIHAEIKNRLTLGNLCRHSVHNLLASSLISKNSKNKIYETIISPGVFYWSEMWPLA
jgi:hypothetical protein